MSTIKNNNGKISWTYYGKSKSGFTDNFHTIDRDGKIVRAFADVKYDAKKKTWDVGVYTASQCVSTYYPCSDAPTDSDLFEVCHNVEVWTIPLVLAGFGCVAFCDENGNVYE